MRAARVGAIGAFVAACTLVACQDTLLRPAAARPASVSMTVTLDQAVGGASEAFDHADGLVLRFSAGGELQHQETLPFSPSGAALSVDVPLRQLSEEMTVDLELQAGGRPLFRGSTSATFSSGVTSTLQFTLAPVVASVSCDGPTLVFSTYGRSQLLSAAALFATGDTVPGSPVTWSVNNAAVASITSAGLVTAVADGDASVTCASGEGSGTRAVKVFAVVTQVDVVPATVTLHVGDTVTLKPTLRDSGRAVISTSRPLTWSASNAAAIVSSSGLVTATGAGTDSISATSGTAAGRATVVVVQAPSVTTQAATNVTASAATLNAAVNPNGNATQAWFRYGTSATLDTSSDSPLQSIGSGSTSTPVFSTLTGLQPLTTYYFRALASSASGTAQGSILSFTTSAAAPVLGTTSGVLTCAPAFCSTVMSSSVNPGGLPTQAWFEYSQDPSFLSFSSTAKQSVGGGAFVSFSAQAPTGFYFRAAAQNALGTVRSTIIAPIG